MRTGVLCKHYTRWKRWVITCSLPPPPSPLSFKKSKQNGNTHSTARWNLRVVLALYHDPRGFCVFSFLSDLTPGAPSHPQFCPTLLWYICIPDLQVLFPCGHESPLLELRHEKFFAAHNPQQNTPENPPLAVSCPVVEWVIMKVVAPWRKSLLFLYLLRLGLAQLLACSRCSAKICWMKLGAQGELVGARQPGVESKGGQGSPLQNPGCYRARLLFSFQEGLEEGFSISLSLCRGYCLSLS